MRVLSRIFWYGLAVLFLVEAWLWDKSVALGEWIAARIPFAAFKAGMVRLIDRLPPLAVLPIFILPMIVILPFKIAALWLIGHGKFLFGGLAFAGAKLAGVGVAAFLFDLTRDKLLSMRWFERLYLRVMSWRAWAHALIDPYKAKIRAAVAPFRARIRARLAELRGNGAFGRKLAALRARMRRRLS